METYITYLIWMQTITIAGCMITSLMVAAITLKEVTKNEKKGC